MYENLFKTPLYRVFVYGTLKRGEPNHELLNNAENGYAKFLGIGKTLSKYPLVIATKYNIPFLLKKAGTGNQVLGEVYDVDSKMLTKLDELEDHPQFYQRTEDEILMTPDVKSSKESTTAWIYFLPKFNESLLKQTMYTCYTNEGSHKLKYTERYLRDKSYDVRNDVMTF